MEGFAAEQVRTETIKILRGIFRDTWIPERVSDDILHKLAEKAIVRKDDLLTSWELKMVGAFINRNVVESY